MFARVLRIMVVLTAVSGVLCLDRVSAETSNRVVAIVNDDVITLHELNKKLREVTGLSPGELQRRDESGFIETRRQVLELLIDERIAREKIKELGIEVSEDQIDGAIEKIKQDNQWTQEDLLAGLQQQGLTYAQYRESVKKDIETFKLINQEVKSKIVIKEEDVALYYETHKDQLATEGKVHLASIFLVPEDPKDTGRLRQLEETGREILARLEQGEDFGALAREFSQGPSAPDGGDLGSFATAQLDPEVRRLVEGMPAGGVSQLIVRPNGIQIIKLIDKKEGKSKSLEEARDAIHALLYKEEATRRYLDWIKELRENSYTKTCF